MTSRHTPYRLTLLCLALAGLLAGCPKQEEQPQVGGGQGTTEAITLSADHGTLILGGTMELFAIAHVGTGAVRADDSVTWNVDPPGVAKMTEPGVLMGLKAGTTTVTAKRDGVTSNALEIQVLRAPPPESTETEGDEQ